MVIGTAELILIALIIVPILGILVKSLAKLISKSAPEPIHREQSSKAGADILDAGVEERTFEVTIEEALKIARGISDEFSRSESLGNIASALADAGEPSYNQVFEEALKIARGISDKGYRSESLGNIASALAKAGEFEEALEIARDLEGGRFALLRDIASALAKAGEFEEALEIARDISDELSRSQSLGNIASALAEAGEFEKALEIARDVSYTTYRSKALGDIASALAGAGEFEKALKIARDVSYTTYRSEALGDIASALAKAGEPSYKQVLEEAIKNAKDTSAGFLDLRSEALGYIASALAKAGEPSYKQVFEEAIKTAMDSEHKTTALTNIVPYLADAGEFEEALKIAKGMSRYYSERSEALRHIASALAKAGEPSHKQIFEEALKTARDMDYEKRRSKALGDIASALAKVSLREREKKISDLHEWRKTTTGLFDLAQHLSNKAIKLFENKKYNEALQAFEESLSKFIQAKTGAEGLKDEGLVKAIENNIYSIKKSIIACKNAIGISFSEDAKKSFDVGNYESAISAYKNSITKFEDALKDAKEIEEHESVERIGELIKRAEDNIENCHTALDKREVENLFRQSKSLHEKAAELAKGGEMFNAKGVLRKAEEKINSAFEISTKRKFSDAVNKLNLLLKTIRDEMNVIDEKIAGGITSVDFSADIFKVKMEGEPEIEIPIRKKELALTIERAIYDPCKRDFIERPLARMKEWINRYDPGAYWFALSIQNNSDRAIEEWVVELETSAALKVKESKIEGIEIEIPHEAHLGLFKISVPKEYGIVIPKGGAQRVYFKLRADKPKTIYEISGVFKSIFGEVSIRAKEFKYLCDAGMPPEAVKAELKRTFSEKDAARLALSFKTVQELDRMCDQDTKTEEYLDKLSMLRNYTEGFSDRFSKHVDEFARFMKEEQLGYLDDAYKEKVRRFCTNMIDVWISEFLKK